MVTNRNQQGTIHQISENEPEESEYTAQVIAPIVSAGEPIGAVILLSKDPNVTMGETESKIAEAAAAFLGKQMEQ